ncbi:hypothetical protein EXN66_Car016114 [Channa argus]|uniref:Uncharacterized protein n=1 Tax=Channa argus TaxID=215402 RepID=A0A6G1QD71_CHAAH|nr:hypothetical protein EXN66_Car016114 [Channa argus]
MDADVAMAVSHADLPGPSTSINRGFYLPDVLKQIGFKRRSGTVVEGGLWSPLANTGFTTIPQQVDRQSLRKNTDDSLSAGVLLADTAHRDWPTESEHPCCSLRSHSTIVLTSLDNGDTFSRANFPAAVQSGSRICIFKAGRTSVTPSRQIAAKAE